MREVAAALIKFAMLAIFAVWLWRNFSQASCGKIVESEEAEAGRMFRLKLVLFCLAAYVALFLSKWRTERAGDLAGWFLLYAVALLLTLAIELSVARFMGYAGKRELGAVALCSLATHPALHLAAHLPALLFGQTLYADHWAFYMEGMVVVAESGILNGLLPRRRADNAWVALCMNVVSFLIGVAITGAALLCAGGFDNLRKGFSR